MNSDKIVQIYSRSPDVSGVKVIIDNISNSLTELGNTVYIKDKIEKINKDYIIIPYGIREAFDLFFHGLKAEIILMVDAYSLGCKNYAIYMIKNRIINKALFRQIFSFFFYSVIEYLVLQKYSTVMLVSEHDKKYFEKKFFKTFENIIIVPNGVIINQENTIKEVSSQLRLGVIAYWSPTAFLDIEWFIEYYFPFLCQKIPTLKLVIAGRGADEGMINKFSTNPNIEFIGEIDSVDIFYDKIDVYIITVIKECGILNKALEAFANKKAVIGRIHNFFPFKNLKNGFLQFTTKEELLNILLKINKGELKLDTIVQNAFQYVCYNHNWVDNYRELVDIINNYTEINKKE